VPYTIPFSCRWSDSGVGAAWVRVAGDLDLGAAPQLEATLQAAQLHASKVVLDLPPATGSATYARETVWAQA
jgi:hypothetical protein